MVQSHVPRYIQAPRGLLGMIQVQYSIKIFQAVASKTLLHAESCTELLGKTGVNLILNSKFTITCRIFNMIEIPATIPLFPNNLLVFSALTTCNWVLLTHSNSSFSVEESILEQIILPISIPTASAVQIFNDPCIFNRKALPSHLSAPCFAFAIINKLVHRNQSIFSKGLFHADVHYHVNYFSDIFFMFVTTTEENVDGTDIAWQELPPYFCLLPSDMTIFHVSTRPFNLHSAFKLLPVCESGQACLVPLAIAEKGQSWEPSRKRRKLNLYGLKVETINTIPACKNCLNRLDRMDLTALIKSEATKLPNFKLFRIMQDHFNISLSLMDNSAIVKLNPGCNRCGLVLMKVSALTAAPYYKILTASTASCTVMFAWELEKWNIFHDLSAPFTTKTWVTMFALVIVIARLLQQIHKLPLQAAVGLTVAPLLGVVLPLKRKSQLLYGVWIFATIFIVSAYLSKLQSHQIAPNEYHVSKSIKELHEENYRILTTTPATATRFKFLRNILEAKSGNLSAIQKLAEDYRHLDEMLQDVKMDSLGLYGSLNRGKYGLFRQRDSAIIAQRILMDVLGINVFFAEENLLPGPYSWIFNLHHADAVAKAFSGLINAGISNYWEDVSLLIEYKKYKKILAPLASQQGNSTVGGHDGIVGTSDSLIAACFYCLCVGLALASFTAGVELCMYCRYRTMAKSTRQNMSSY